jgi:hypothetical protein
MKTMTIAWGTATEQGNPQKREQAVGYVINLLFHPVALCMPCCCTGKIVVPVATQTLGSCFVKSLIQHQNFVIGRNNRFLSRRGVEAILKKM